MKHPPRHPIAEMLLLGLLTGAMFAGTALARSTDRDQQLDVRAGGLDGPISQNGVTRLTDVIITQGSLRIEAARATVSRDDGEVTKVVLQGEPASLQQENDDGVLMKAQARRIDYDTHIETVVLTGAVRIDQGRDWRSNLRKSWSAFSESFITIRRRNGNTEALISPQQTWYLKENLKTRLLQAQLAVYREQQAVYEDNLTKADKWLEQYFDPNDTVSQYMHSEIAKLLEQPVVLEYPKQFASQHQLEELVHQRLQHLMAQ